MKVGFHYAGKATTFYLDDLTIALNSFGKPGEETPVDKVLWNAPKHLNIFGTGQPNEIKVLNNAGKTVQVYNMKGLQVLNKHLRSDFELLNVPSGIMIVVVENSKAIKVKVE